MTAPNPAIVLISEHHVDTLSDEFGRYARDYDIYPCTSAPTGLRVAPRDVVVAGGQVAMFVTESVLPDADVHMAFHKLRGEGADRAPAWSPPTGTGSSPTVRRCGPAMAKGKFDAYLLMPRGVRDEEFHNAITDLLSDWGSTVPRPRGGVGQDHLARRGTR